MALIGDGEFAVAKRVPELDGTVARAGDNLTVIGGEGYRQDVVLVSDESFGGSARSKLPKTKSLVP